MAYSAGNLELDLIAIDSNVIKTLNAVNSSLSSLSSTVNSLNSKKLKDFGNLINKTKNIGSNSFNFKRLFNVAIVLRFGRAVARIVQYGSNFTETLNLWQVAMRDNLKQADEFIKKMNRAYGISQTTLMNAQATFKNMIGSLGNISDAVSYQLSESILQMALDFSSLYNVAFENAIQKFQAALAGQVRPVRSVSGYDITENTLQQIYEQLGGTKSQRQLNRTEKQLLAIYAILQQMQKSGAVGDLAKTLDSFANQSRMMSENLKELATYTGLFLQNLLQSWGVLKYINAALIFVTEIMKALTNYQAPNFLENMFETVADTNKEVDELQGKLLDFDKFRVLNSSSADNAFGIDQTLINALTGYQSILDNVNNEARNIATGWLKDIGLLISDINGDLVINEDKLKDIKSTLVGIVASVGFLIGTKTIFGFVTLFSTIKKLIGATSLLSTKTLFLNNIIGASLIFSIVKLVYAFKEGDTNAQLLYATISGWLIYAFISLNKEMLKTVGIKIIEFFKSIGNVARTKLAPDLLFAKKNITGLQIALTATAFVLTSIAADKYLSSLGDEARKVVSPIFMVTGAILGLVTAIAAYQAISSGGTVLPYLFAMGASIGVFAAGLKNTIQAYSASTSNIDSGVLSTATSATKTPNVYSGDNTNVSQSNASQLKGAVYQALVEYGKNHTENTPIVLNLDGEVAYKTVVRHALMRGEFLSKR